MESSLLILLIIPFGIMVLVWFVLLHKLHRAIAKLDPALFASLGKPSVLGRGSFANDRRLIHLISGRGITKVHDTRLVARLRFMRLWAISMLLLFFGFIWGAAQWPAP